MTRDTTHPTRRDTTRPTRSEVLALVRKSAASGYTPHKSTHVTGGSDALSADDIGALPETAFVGLAHIHVQATAPISPSVGDVWIDTSG